MTTKTKLRLLAVSAAAVLLTPIPAGLALATTTPKDYAKRGDACTVLGEERQDRSGDWYVCQKRKGDPCPVWHARDPKKGPWPSRKAPTCPACTPKPSPSSSASPSTATPTPPSTHPSASSPPDTTTVGSTLPITGIDRRYIAAMGALGLFAVVIGGVAVYVLRPRKRRP